MTHISCCTYLPYTYIRDRYGTSSLVRVPHTCTSTIYMVGFFCFFYLYGRYLSLAGVGYG